MKRAANAAKNVVNFRVVGSGSKFVNGTQPDILSDLEIRLRSIEQAIAALTNEKRMVLIYYRKALDAKVGEWRDGND